MSQFPRTLVPAVATLCALTLLPLACSEPAAPQLATRPEARQRGPALALSEPRHVPLTLSDPQLAAQATPLSLTRADVDGDGFEDLIAGYRLSSGGGLLVLQRGNRQAVAPSAPTAVVPAPFLREAQTVVLPVAPELLAAVRLDPQGTLELFAAAREGRQLVRVAPRDDGAAPVSMEALPGAITALASGDLAGAPRLLVGYRDGQAGRIRVMGNAAPQEHPLPGAVTAFASGELDGDARTDVALLAGGQLWLLRGQGGLTNLGLGRGAQALAVGHFIPEQSGRQQLAVLNEDGSLEVAAHLDARPAQTGTPRMNLAGRGRPLPAQEASGAPPRFQVIESLAALGPPRAGTLLFPARISGNPGQDLALLSPELGELTLVSHPRTTDDGQGYAPAQVSTRPHPGAPVAAVAMRVDTPATEGLVTLEQSQMEAVVITPQAAATFNVNTTSDTMDANPGNGVCMDAAGQCSLRAAVMESNANPGSDTIQVPAGAYTLTRAGANEDGALTGDLDIREGVAIVGAGPTVTFIQAGTSATGTRVDKIFSVNPTFSSAFATSLSGVTLRYGRNPSSYASGVGFGGALDWEASGTGTLTLTDCIIEDNETLDGDGGGLALTSFPAGGRATLTNVIVRRNKAARATVTNIPVGGGVFVGTQTALQMTGGALTANRAVGNVSPDWKGQGGGVYLFGPSGPTPSFFAGTDFSGNQAGQVGGGVHTGQGLLFTGEPVFDGNQALNGTGGALFHNVSNETTTLTKATFTGNSAAAPAGSAVVPSGGAIQVGSGATGNVLGITLSRFAGNTVTVGVGGPSPSTGQGLAVATTGGTVSAENNWWSCSTVPSAAPCNTAFVSGGSIDFDPWLRLTHVASPTTLQLDASSALTASFLTNSSNTAMSLSDLSLLLGLPITFTPSAHGSVSGAQAVIQPNGMATATFLATGAGAAFVDAVVDGGPTRANLTVLAPDLTVTKTHLEDFTQGDVGRSYTLTVTNSGAGRTKAGAAVSVVDTLPASLTATGLSGTGWSCTLATLTCSRSEVMAAGSSHPPITLTVDVDQYAPPLVTNTATVSGGGQLDLANDSVDDDTVIIQLPDLVVAKSHVGDFRQGQPAADYTLTVTNAGPGPTVSAVTLTDTLPAGLTATAMAGTGWTCALPTLSCSRSDVLASGAAYPAVTLTVQVADDAGTPLTNQAQVSGGGELETTNNQASDVTTVVKVGDLVLAKSHTGDFRQGQTGATFTLTVSNLGPGNSLGTVAVTDTLPSELTATALSGTGWTCDLPTLTCTRADVLAPSASYPAIALTVDVAGDAPGSVTNTAAVSGGGELRTDNNGASDSATVIPVADLTLAKSHAGDFRQGQLGASYSLAVSNPGPGATVGTVTVTDTLPAGLTATALAGDGWTCDVPSLTCARSDVLASGASYPVITLTVEVSASAPASVTNSATVGGGGELNTANNAASDPTTVIPVADLTLAKSHTGNLRQGQSGAVYSLAVTNGGVGPTVGPVSVTDTLPAELTATGLAGTGWTCDLPSLTCTRSDVLASGGSYPLITLTVDVSATAPTTVTNSAAVSGGGELNTSNNTGSDPATVIAVADLVVDKAHAGDLRQGDTGSYTLTVTNNGSGPTLGAVTLVDTLPAGLTGTALSGAGWTCDLPTLTCTRSDVLASGAAYPAVTLTVQVADDAATPLTNQAQVSGGGELETTNNSASDVTTVIGVGDLVLAKSHSGDFRQGQTGAAFVLTAANLGPGDTLGTVTVVDTLPAGLTATAVGGTGWTCDLSTVTCTRSDVLAPGATYPAITLTVDVDGDAPGSLTNTAAVSGGGELRTDNNGASDSATVTPVADLTLAKVHSGDFRQGQTGASYSLTVSNPGVGDTQGAVTVTDLLPAGLTATALAGAGWTCEVPSLTCTRTDVLASGGSYPVITLTVDVSASAPASVTNSATVNGGGELNTANNGASDPTTVTPVADLILAKSHTGTLRQGQTGALYSLVVTNGGAGPTVGPVSVTDTLPADLEATGLAGTGWTCDLPSLTCTRSDVLASGAAYPAILLTVDVSATAPQDLTNTAAVSGGGELDTSNNSAADPATVTASADLVVDKAHAGDLRQGGIGSYSLTVRNDGSGPTLGAVTVADILPTGLTATGISGTGWTCDLATVSCTRADALASATSYEPILLAVSVAADTAALVVNQAAVTGGGDRDTSNNTDLDPTNVEQVADLQLAKSHLGDFRQGQVGAVYTLTVTNAGEGPTNAPVSVTDTLPTGLVATGFSGAGWTCDLPALSCSRPDVLAEGSAYPALTLTVDVASDATSLTNMAQVSGGGELETGNNTAWDQTTVLPAGDLVVAKSHTGDFRQGQTGASYSLVVSNIGLGPTQGTVSVTDLLPVELTATAMTGDGWSCDLSALNCSRTDPLAVGAAYPAVTLTVDVAASAPDSVTNTAAVSGGGESDTTNNSTSDPTTVLKAADLTVSKSHVGDFTQGQTGATYSLQVENVGLGSTAGEVVLTDLLPAGLTATALAGDGWSCALATLACVRSEALAPGATYPVVTLTVDVAEDAPAVVTNTAQVSGGGELETGNNQGTDAATVVALPDLTVALSHPGDFVIGQTDAQYTLLASNVGRGQTVGEVVVTVQLPAGLLPTALEGEGWSCALETLRCTRSDVLNAAASYPELRLTAEVLGGAGEVETTASISGGGQRVTSNDGASDPTTVLETPAFGCGCGSTGTGGNSLLALLGLGVWWRSRRRRQQDVAKKDETE